MLTGLSRKSHELCVICRYMLHFLLWLSSLLLLYVEYTSQFGDCWPLDEERKSNLIKNRYLLNEHLSTDDDLIGEILKHGCFTFELMQNVRSSTNLTDRNELLLDILARNSIEKFKLFESCLHITQPHLSALLTGDTGKNKWILIRTWSCWFCLCQCIHDINSKNLSSFKDVVRELTSIKPQKFYGFTGVKP